MAQLINYLGEHTILKHTRKLGVTKEFRAAEVFSMRPKLCEEGGGTERPGESS